MLRPYQQRAHDAAMDWLRKSIDPCLIEAATGSGKSHVIAAIARTLNTMTGKRVLCLAPSAELVVQNTEKYRATGNKASVFSASAGSKCLRHPVVMGTPGTIKNKIRRFGDEFCAVVVDECFPGETEISTPKGDVRIDEISIGDVVHCATGFGTVSSVFSNISETITVRTKNGKSIRCTPDHPVFTEKGFIKAEELENGARVFCREDVQTLFETFSSKNDDNKKRENSCEYFGITLEQARMLLSILLKEVEKPDAEERKQGEDEILFAKNRTCSGDKGRERMPPESSATFNLVRSWRRMGDGVCYKNKCRSFKRGISKLLQGGYWKPRNENSNRIGWVQSLLNRSGISGQEKRQQTFRAGMDCVSHIERGRVETVYNLRVKGHPSYFANGVLVHNCHGMTPTVKFIIDQLREVNPRVRVLGLSATPYRLGEGWIFRMDENGNPMEQARDPYFMARVYKVGAHELIEQGFLTPPVIGAINADSYDTLGMALNSRGQFDKADIDRAYHGHGRKTSRIIADVISQARDRAGVMIFAATVQHAHECMASLPPGLSAIVTGKTPKAERADIIRRFKARQLKYLVNVSVLTTGFDAPHVDVIAILRAIESVGLLQQIIGRGLRIDDDKDDCLILDYAENLDRHCPDGDVFNPEIKMSFASGESVLIPAVCPACGTENRFSARKNEEGFEINQQGYFVDLDGNEIPTDHGPMPAHYGRRCMGAQRSGPNGEHERCDYRWTVKKCPHCDADNDIAARYCCECKGEIVDPNEKLRSEFKALKRDPTRIQTDRVIAWDVKPTVGRSGKECIRVDYTTEYRSFAVWYHPWAQGGPMYAAHHQFIHHTNGGETMPETITYRKNPDNGFYTIHDYGRPADEIPA